MLKTYTRVLLSLSAVAAISLPEGAKGRGARGKRIALAVGILLLLAPCSLLQVLASAQTLTVDASKVLCRIEPLIYGAGAEDVNHEIYGGLYDQKIFGEGFEEPAFCDIKGFKAYDERWSISSGMAVLQTSNHGKLIYEEKQLSSGSVEVEFRMDDLNAIAGLIVNVSGAANGADAFNGYEVALNARLGSFVLGKHQQNWQPISDTPTSFNPLGSWNKLRVIINQAKLTIYLNGTRIKTYEDTNSPLTSGFIGLRSYGGSATFRNLKVAGQDIAFESDGPNVSGMWTALGEGIFDHDSSCPFTGKYAQKIASPPPTSPRGGRLSAAELPSSSGEGLEVGAYNMGLNRWGIGINKDERLKVSMYLKGSGRVEVALQSADGSKEYAREEINGITDNWQRFDVELTPNDSDPKGRFVLQLAEEGSIWVDQVLLCTDSYPFRSDITEAFRQQHLTFLRYGGTMVNAAEYMTRNMTGSRLERQPYYGHWYRYATNGFAIPEFVEFARLIGTEPCFAINIEDNPDDVLALLRYMEQGARGKEQENTNCQSNPLAPCSMPLAPSISYLEQGARGKEQENTNCQSNPLAPCSMPLAPSIKYIEIGNEENLFSAVRRDYEHYVERYLVLYEAIHAAYPELQFINAAWWRPDEVETMKYVFQSLDGKCDLWDYHPWTETPQQAKDIEAEIAKMRRFFLEWNPQTTMRCAILEENGNTHDMARALAHAVMLNVVRRSAGFVPLDSPANALQPYKQNDNGWDQGQIFFSPSQVWMQPPFYAQQMAARNHQPLLVESSCSTNTNLDYTATRNEAGDTIVLHIVNYGAQTRGLTLNLTGFGEVGSIKALSLSGTLNGENTPERPTRFVPVEQAVTPGSRIVLKANSYNVIVVASKDAGTKVQAALEKKSDGKCYDLSGRVLTYKPNGFYIQDGMKWIR